MDCNSYRFGAGSVLSDNNVGVASDSSDLQNTLAVGLCDAPYAQAA